MPKIHVTVMLKHFMFTLLMDLLREMDKYTRYLILSTLTASLPTNCQAQDLFPLKYHVGKDFKDDWPDYFEYTKHIKEPRDSLKKAVQEFWTGSPGTVADLGAGAGRDTIYLLNQGWNVYAMDIESMAVQIIVERATHVESEGRLLTEVAPFHLMQNCPQNVDIMNASYSLPFCSNEFFLHSWEKVVENLKSGGLFVGQFFGLRDAWTWDKSMTFLSTAEVLNLFSERFEILYLYQEEKETLTSDGFPTYRHCYHIIARKK